MNKFVYIGLWIALTAGAATPLKPCADRPGSAYPDEGSGNCRGNLMLSIPLATVGMSLVYNSQSKRNIGFGLGWSLSFDSMFEQTSASTGILYLGDGTPIEFTFQATQNAWLAKYPILFTDRIEQRNAQTLIHSRVNGSVDTYLSLPSNPTRFYLAQGSSRRGVDFSIARYSTGEPKTLIDAFNRKTNISYVNAGKWTVADYAGQLYSLVFDGNRNLIQVWNPDGTATKIAYRTGTSIVWSVTNPRNQTTKFDFYGTGGSGSLKLIIDYEGQRTSYVYSAEKVTETSFWNTLEETFLRRYTGITLSTTQGGAASEEVYDVFKRLTNRTDVFDRKTSYSYRDALPVPSARTLPDGTSLAFEYYPNLLLHKATEKVGTRSVVTQYDRDAFGNVTKLTENGVVTGFVFDGRGNLTRVTDPALQRVNFAAEYEGPRLLKSVTNAGGNSVIYGHDSVGNVISVIHPSGEVVEVTPTALGQPSQIVSKLGDTVIALASYSYDSIGRLTAALSKVFNGENNTANQVTNVYGPNETVSTVEAAKNGVPFNGTRTTFDVKGRVTKSEILIVP